MFTYTLIRGTGLIALLLTFVIGVIRARPYDPHSLRLALLDGPDCQKPCWQHIRPGVTTVDEALHLLQHHAWVADVTQRREEISWSWSGQQDARINASQPGRLVIAGDRVIAVGIPATIGMGDLFYLLGKPLWTGTERFRGRTTLRLTYPAEFLVVTVTTRCRSTRGAFWLTQPELVLRSQPTHGAIFPGYVPVNMLRC